MRLIGDHALLRDYRHNEYFRDAAGQRRSAQDEKQKSPEN